MVMKKLKIWHLMMLSIFALLTMVACGSEDDINSDIPQLIRCPRPSVTGPQKATSIATAIMIRT